VVRRPGSAVASRMAVAGTDSGALVPTADDTFRWARQRRASDRGNFGRAGGAGATVDPRVPERT